MKKTILNLIFIAVVIFAASTQNKTALLIANGSYETFSKLIQPVPEALQLKSALERLGFHVIMLSDAGRESMLDGLAAFEQQLNSRGGIALFHYGGHAVQVNGKNYLIPADAEIPDERRVSTRAIDAEEVLAALESSGSDTNIVILDACRNNPLAGDLRNSIRGLAVVGRKPPNSIIVYSAEPGTTARDGIFTPTLISFLEIPGLSFTDILRKTRQKVYDMTNGSQTPGAYDQLFQPVYLSGSPVVQMSEGLTAETPSSGKASMGILNDSSMVFVQEGAFLMGSSSGEDNEQPLHSVLIKGFYMSKYEVTQREFQSLMGRNPSSQEKGLGEKCPVNQVSWWDAIDYCNALSLREGLTPCYSGSGAEIRCNFGADGYRLPTEAEWEYAARGGNISEEYTYAGGNSLDNVAWYLGNSDSKVHRVGQKEPNEIGLYDLTGNVWEWCWDWQANYSRDTQRNPSGPSSGMSRILRGGGWYSHIPYCHLTVRGASHPSSKGSDYGFRVVRRAE